MGKWFAILLLLLSIFSVQFGASIAKKLFPVLGPAGVCFLRIAVATVILVGVWRPWRFHPTRKQIRTIATYGVALGVMNLTYYLSLQRLPLGIAVALEFIGPLSVALFYSRRLLDFLWAILAITGIVLILPRGQGDLSLAGIALALTAGAGWAFYIIFGKRASGAAPSGVTTSIGMSVALLTVSPVALPRLEISHLMDPWIALAAVGVGLLSSALPYSLEMAALRHVPSRNFGVLMSLSPAVAALSGYFVLHEALTLTQEMAIACILMASFGSALAIPPEAPKPIEV